jgi:hypothetical protein
MKTMGKLVMLLAVLAICMPAQGEILIYSKQYNCWWAASADLAVWNMQSWTQKGFLVLDVEYDSGEIVAINQAEQIEYEKEDDGDKVYWQIEEDYEIERIEVDGEVIWVIEYVYADNPTSAEIIMVRGKPKNKNIGLGRNAKREVARQLTGYILYLDIGMGVQKEMCTMSLRLHSGWTKCANDPEECDQDFDCARLDIVKAWLERRGYEEVI